MPTPLFCAECQKQLREPLSDTGICDECLRCTGLLEKTAKIKVSEIVPQNPTLTHLSSQETASFQLTTPEPPSSLNRVVRLRAAGWLDVRPLNHSAMSELYVGFDPRLDRQVVAKFLLNDEPEPVTRTRFELEAITLARLSHPNMIRMFQYVDGRDPYLVLEYVSGGSLANRLRGDADPISYTEAAELLEGAARGIAEAHAHGVIHRDIKPGNILLDTTGPKTVAKIADLGMARDITAVESITLGNAMIGTPEYMSPEQAARLSSECTAESDVWGLAATLYAAVTSQAPFNRDLRNPPVLHQPVTPPHLLRPDIPADLAAIIMKGLEKDPRDRYPTATAFADELVRFLNGKPVVGRPRSLPIRLWRRVEQLPRVASALVLIALLSGLGLSAALRPDSNAKDERVHAALSEVRRGNQTEFVPSTGLPVFTRPMGTVVAMGVDPRAGGSFVVDTPGTSFVQLSPPIPCDKYELSLELADLQSIPGPGGLPAHTFGSVIGLSEVEIPQGVIITGLRVVYHDCAAGAPTGMSRADFEYFIFNLRDGVMQVEERQWLGTCNLIPSRTHLVSGQWRKHRYELSSKEIVVHWVGDNGIETKMTTVLVADLNDIIDGFSKKRGVALPAWSPRSSFGVFAEGCAVGVREAKITPR